MDPIIIKLADIIAKHSSETIQKKLRIIALEKKTPENPEKKLFLLADQFVTQCGERDDHWTQPHSSCFSELSHWFLESTKIENHLIFAVVAWKCHIQHKLTNAITAKDMVVLGSAFYAEPPKFMGFLYWLLTSDVTPKEIGDSRILHDFFAYQVINISEIESAYAILFEINHTAIDDFFTYTQKKSCGMRGFCNNPSKNNNTYSSYNLLGKIFTHTTKENETLFKNKTLKEMEVHTITAAPTLFDLFEWEIIKKLNFKSDTHARFLSTLFHTPLKTKILKEFPTYALSGFFSKALSEFMLNQIQDNLGNAEIAKWVYQEPFYMHAIDFTESSPFISSGVISSLCGDEKYKTLPHLFYLTKLVRSLDTDNISFVKQNTAEINEILNAIFKVLLQYGNSIPDESIDDIEPILPKLQPLADEAIGSFYQNIKNGIEDFLNDIIDYDALSQIWGSQLSNTNLLLQIYPPLHEKNYPATVYDLQAQILQQQHHKKQSFLVWDLLSKITTDTATQCRIIQETIVHPTTELSLAELILKQCDTHFSVNILCTTPFGHEGSVLYHAIKNQNSDLYETIATFTSLNQHLLALTTDILNSHDMKIIQFLWERIAFNDLASKTITDLLIQQLRNTECLTTLELPYFAAKDLQDFYFQKLRVLLCEKKVILSQPDFQFIFENAVKYDQLSFLAGLCTQDSVNKPSPNTISQTLKNIHTYSCSLSIIGFFCGLSGIDRLDSAIIKPNNVRRFLAFRFEFSTQGKPSYLLTYKNTKNESLLQIMVNFSSLNDLRLHLGIIKEMLSHDSAEINDFLNQETTQGNLIRCTNSQNPDQEKINQYLEVIRREYGCKLSDDANLTNTQKTNNLSRFFATTRSRSRSSGSEITTPSTPNH